VAASGDGRVPRYAEQPVPRGFHTGTIESSANAFRAQGTTMILEVKHLQLVEALAAYGTLTNAGKHLNLTQSALSHQLVELERRLGTPLFHRIGRRLVPTLAGDRLLRSATRTLSILRRTESSLKRIAAGHEALLRFSTACYTTYHWLAPLLDEYSRRCPKVEV